MSRTVATVWHASLSTLAAILYFLFVLPRWWELTGYTSQVVGTVLRIGLGLLIAGTALPVAAALKQARKPEYRTPQLALTLLTGSMTASVVAGALIAATAVSEIWLSLDKAGMWLFGIYGAAAAIALLGVGAYYLASVAELPPPPPKPIKPQAEKKRRWRKKAAAETEATEATEDDAEDAEDDAGETDDADADEAEDADETEDAAAEITESAGEEAADLAPAGGQDKLRPTGKRRAKKDQ